MQYLKIFISIILIVTICTGCTALQGTLVGGGIGAGTGAVVGSATNNAGAGTAIGAGIGALTGLIVGAVLQNQPKPVTVVTPVSVPAASAGQIIVACPKCSQHVDVTGFAPGSQVRCPVCNQIFTF